MGKDGERIRFDFPAHVNLSLQEQIRLADTKAAWVFSVLGVATGALVTSLARVAWDDVNRMIVMMLVGVAAVLLIFSFKHVVGVIYPRLGNGKKDSFIYFGSIIQEQKSSYIRKGDALTLEEIRKDLYGQAHALASILSHIS